MKNTDLTPDDHKLLKDIEEYGQQLKLPPSLSRRAIQEKLGQTSVEHTARKRTINPFIKYSSIAAAFLILVISLAVLIPEIMSEKPSDNGLISSSTTEDNTSVNQALIQTPPELALPDVPITAMKADSYDAVYDVIYNILHEYELQGAHMYRGYKTEDNFETAPAVESSGATMLTDSAKNITSGVSTSSVSPDNTDYSTTNLQVAGVDEADIVKTDGSYIYIMDTNNFDNRPNITILSVDKAQMQQVGSFSPYPQDKTLSYFTPHDMYLVPASDRLVVLASGYADHSYTDIQSKVLRTRIHGEDVFILTYDITDRSNPVLISTNTQEGGYRSSRLVNGYLYVMSECGSPVFSCREMVREDAKYYVPMVNDQPQSCNRIFLPEGPTTRIFTTVSALDINNPSSFTDSTSVLCGNSLLYVSNDSIYLTSPVAYTRGDETSLTEIIKLSYSNGTITLAAATKVKGSLGDQFAIDETNGYLRLVSTVEYYEERFFEIHQEPYNDYGVIFEKPDVMYYGSEQESIKQDNDATDDDIIIDAPDDDVIDDEPAVVYYPETVSQSNSLYILDSSLQLVGAIENLAEGERIYSARFIGDTGYFVTFRQTDPLFSVDLSDSTDPKVLGELKIPGFSEYLHPYSDHLLLGIGMNANEQTGMSDFVKLSMFDISDPTNVIEKDTLILDGYTHSDALYNHKSVLIDAAKDIIGFPAGGWDETDNSSTEYGDYLIYGYDENTGFTQKLRTGYSYSWDNYYDDDNIPNYYYCYAIKRGLYISDTFYVINTAYNIKAFDFNDYTELEELKFEY